MTLEDNNEKRSLPHGSTQFLVGHPRILLSLAPQFGYFIGLDKLENAVLPPLPSDEAGICYGVQKKIADEFPQLPVALP